MTASQPTRRVGIINRGPRKPNRPLDFEPTPGIYRRFWSKVRKSGECWLWTAGTNGSGYGQMWVAGGRTLAHRISWYLEHGPFEPGLQVLHTCDRPRCVRPSHLRLGTQTENMADRSARGRWTPAARQATEDEAAAIRVLYSSGENPADLAARAGVSVSCVRAILSGRRHAGGAR